MQGKVRTLTITGLLSAAWFFILPIMTSPCTPYFDRNTVICENRWAWLGGFHIVNQKLHRLFKASFDQWHNYIAYHYWHLGLLLLTCLAMGVITYLFIKLLKRPQKKLPRSIRSRKFWYLLAAVFFLFSLNTFAVMTANKLGRQVDGPIFDTENARIQNDTVAAFGEASGPHKCMFNSQDTCYNYASVDFYPRGESEDASNPNYGPVPNAEVKEIAGVIKSFGGNRIDLKTSSGRIFTIIFPVDGDVIESWNSNHSSNYGNQYVGIGTTLQAMYQETRGKHSTIIDSSNLAISSIILDPSTNKTSATKFYANPQ